MSFFSGFFFLAPLSLRLVSLPPSHTSCNQKTHSLSLLSLTVFPRRERRQSPPERHEVPLPPVERQQEVPVRAHERLGVEARRPRREVEAAGRRVRRQGHEGGVSRNGDPEEVEARVVLELGERGADPVEPAQGREPQQRQ